MSQLQFVVGRQLTLALEGRAVETSAVKAVEVADAPAAFIAANFGVFPTTQIVFENDAIGRGAAEGAGLPRLQRKNVAEAVVAADHQVCCRSRGHNGLGPPTTGMGCCDSSRVYFGVYPRIGEALSGGQGLPGGRACRLRATAAPRRGESAAWFRQISSEVTPPVYVPPPRRTPPASVCNDARKSIAPPSVGRRENRRSARAGSSICVKQAASRS